MQAGVFSLETVQQWSATCIREGVERANRSTSPDDRYVRAGIRVPSRIIEREGGMSIKTYASRDHHRFVNTDRLRLACEHFVKPSVLLPWS